MKKYEYTDLQAIRDAESIFADAFDANMLAFLERRGAIAQIAGFRAATVAEIASRLKSDIIPRQVEAAEFPATVYVVEDQCNSPGKILGVAGNQELADLMAAASHDEAGWVSFELITTTEQAHAALTVLGRI